MLPSGTQLVYKNRAGWAHDRLKRAGLSTSRRRGFWQLTEKGTEFAGTHSSPLPESVLESILTDCNDPDARKAFFGAYKKIEMLWEILSPSAELRDHITTYQRLAHLYATVRQAYADQVGFVADLAYKTRRLIEENATQQGLGRLTKSVTFDSKTLEALRGEPGSDERKVFNLVRGLQQQIDDDGNAAPILQPLKERAERVLKDLEHRTVTGLAAMDLLSALAAERDAAMKSAEESGLSVRAFAVAWTLREDAALVEGGVGAMDLAREAEALLARFPNAAVNVDEQRRLRAGLYKPLLNLPNDERSRVVDVVVATLFRE